MVGMSAFGLTWDARIPKAARSCGVATSIRPDHDRPDAACTRLPLVDSSSRRRRPDFSPDAMPCAVADQDCGLPAPDPAWSPGTEAEDPGQTRRR